MKKKSITKEEIIAEYLTGEISYRALEAKYGVASRTICDWILEYQGRKPTYKDKMRKKREKETGQPEKELPKEVKLLQSALRKSELHNKLLEEILRLSKEQTGIDFRKKFGTKRS